MAVSGSHLPSANAFLGMLPLNDQLRLDLPFNVAVWRATLQQNLPFTMGNRYYATSAILTALKHPELFGRVAVQSAYTSGPALGEMTELMEATQTAGIRFYVDWNRYDERNVDREWDLGSHSASLATLLEEHGYPVAGGEAADSVGWGGWRTRTDELLVTLFPAE